MTSRTPLSSCGRTLAKQIPRCSALFFVSLFGVGGFKYASVLGALFGRLPRQPCLRSGLVQGRTLACYLALAQEEKQKHMIN